MTIALVQSKLSQATASNLPTSWNSTPTSGNLLVIRCAVGNGVSAAESITDPANWTPAYGTQPQNNGGAGSSRTAEQTYWRIADGTASDNAPTISVAASSRGLARLSEYSSTNGWPANPVDVVFTATLGTTGTSAATGSGTTAASAIILGLFINVSASTTVSWGGSLSSDETGVPLQGTAALGTASQIVTSATTLTPTVTVGNPSNWTVGAVSFKDNTGGAFNGTAAAAPTVATSAAGTTAGSASVSPVATTSAAGKAAGTASVSPVVAITAAGTTGVSKTASLAITASASATGIPAGSTTLSVTVGTSASGNNAGSGTATVATTATTSASGSATGSASISPVVGLSASGLASGSATAPVTVGLSASGVVARFTTANSAVTVVTAASGTTAAGAAVSPVVGITASGLAALPAGSATSPVSVALSAAGQSAGLTTTAVAVTLSASGVVATFSTASLAVTATTSSTGIRPTISGDAGLVAVVSFSVAGVVGLPPRDITLTSAAGTDRWTSAAVSGERWKFDVGSDRWSSPVQES